MPCAPHSPDSWQTDGRGPPSSRAPVPSTRVRFSRQTERYRESHNRPLEGVSTFQRDYSGLKSGVGHPLGLRAGAVTVRRLIALLGPRKRLEAFLPLTTAPVQSYTLRGLGYVLSTTSGSGRWKIPEQTVCKIYMACSSEWCGDISHPPALSHSDVNPPRPPVSHLEATWVIRLTGLGVTGLVFKSPLFYIMAPKHRRRDAGHSIWQRGVSRACPK